MVQEGGGGQTDGLSFLSTRDAAVRERNGGVGENEGGLYLAGWGRPHYQSSQRFF
jgi:hypothetical protein